MTFKRPSTVSSVLSSQSQTAIETSLDYIRASKTRPWDAADSLKSPQDMVLYLDACLLEGDPALVTAALGDIARAKGMSQLARDTGLGRESLYKALSTEGNPEFATVMKVMHSLGLQLRTGAIA